MNSSEKYMVSTDLVVSISPRPFLLHFAVKRRQAVSTEPASARYDEDLAMTVLDGPDGPVPVISFADYAGARTKKQDIEKGEDIKDQPRPSPRPPKPAPRPRP